MHSCQFIIQNQCDSIVESIIAYIIVIVSSQLFKVPKKFFNSIKIHSVCDYCIMYTITAKFVSAKCYCNKQKFFEPSIHIIIVVSSEKKEVIGDH